MKTSLLIAALLAAPMRSLPQPLPIATTIPAARDVAFPGTMTIKVDATDVTRGIWRVEQTIPVPTAGAMTLLFPKFLPGKHAPRGEVEKLADLRITGNGKPIAWTRDPVDVHAFHITVPEDVRSLDLRFAFLTATVTGQGRITATADMLSLQPEQVSLYPAGWFTRRIPARLTVTWPQGWQAAGALRAAKTDGDTVTYGTVDYETLVDSPFLAGRWMRRWDLGSNVTLNVAADDPRFLAATPAQIDAHKRLVAQALKTFGARHFDHYDLLLSLSDTLGGIGLEHQRSSENGVPTPYFTEWDTNNVKWGPGRRNLLPHEFSHSWCGKYRRPADLFTPDYRTPMRNSLLWVYEGQDQFWGFILQARSGMVSKQDTLDQLAVIAATQDTRPGRTWRPMVDTTNDPIITPRAPKGWVSEQRSEDYYNEGMLIWFEVDAVLRRESGGAKGMDDFARAFFGVNDGDWGTLTYDFDEIVRTLNKLQPYDWAGLLRARTTETRPQAPLTGFTTSGYTLTYTETPSGAVADAQRLAKQLNLFWSGGLVLGTAGKVEQVLWDSAAFAAGLQVGDEIVAIDDKPYSDDSLKAAVTAAKGAATPIRLIVKTQDRLRVVDWAWNGGLRYPRFAKAGGDGSLDRLLTPLP
jgi:predicted metalloprotease with PDZ domain